MRVERSRVAGVAVALVAVTAVAIGVIEVGDRSGTHRTSGSTSTSATAPSTTAGGASSTAVSRPATTTTTTTTPATTRPTTASTTTPPPAVPATVVRHGDRGRRVVALTFDAGSDAGATSRILDLLAARGVRATFGLTGSWVEEFPTLARRIVVEGHGVINHTQDHRSFTGYSTGTAPLPTVERVAELRRAEEVIERTTGANPRPLFRPPFGDYDDSALIDAATAGYRYVVMWSVDSLGWKGLAPRDVVSRTVAALEPGAIVLMHVGSASTDADALPAILDAVERLDLEPVTITDLL
jgi:peptidoglycan/xylan/chitin deacetylase (PgdA/CDA1 family)